MAAQAIIIFASLSKGRRSFARRLGGLAEAPHVGSDRAEKRSASNGMSRGNCSSQQEAAERQHERGSRSSLRIEEVQAPTSTVRWRMATVDPFWAEAKSELKADARRQLEARSASRQPDLCAKVLPEPVGQNASSGPAPTMTNPPARDSSRCFAEKGE